MAVLGISTGFVGIWLGIGLVLLAIYTIEKLAAFAPRALLNGFAVATAIGVFTILLRWAYDQGHIGIDPFLLILPAMIVAFITGTPVSGILALGGIMFFLISGDAPIVRHPVRAAVRRRELRPARRAVLHGGRHHDGNHRAWRGAWSTWCRNGSGT